MSWTSLCEIDELLEGQGKYVEIDGFQLAVFRQADHVYVIDNYCPHAGGNLAAGEIEDGCVVCPWHAWAFRIDSGQLRDAPGVKVRTYPVRLFHRDNRPTLVQADLPIY
jgi:nitrite reductase (NADH) small subunit